MTLTTHASHIKLHENKEFPCDECPKVFKTKTRLSSHSIYHKEPRISCNFENCNKKFYRLECLRTHIKVHLGQRDFPCHLCEIKCFKADHLNKHLINSHKVQTYNCEVPGCINKFAKKDFYRSHLKETHKSLLLTESLIDNLEFKQPD